MKIGVIIDGATVARWQADALEAIAAESEFIIYSCTTPAPARRSWRHSLYYALNLLTVRNRLTRQVEVPSRLAGAARRTFAAELDGAWQRLPTEFIETVAADRPAVLVKFGMGLLRVPPQLGVPILSYHHGDPARFRGRPAGFYELLSGAPVVGQIVQILSDKLDAGRIVAAAETQAIARSYRTTLIEAYRHSPLLLRRAIANAVAGTSWQPDNWGPAYRLPGNFKVVRFVGQRIAATVAHWLYGLFREKSWRVATAPVTEPVELDRLTAGLDQTSGWTRRPTPRGYHFVADPFFAPDGSLLVEGLRSASARGEILRLAGDGSTRLSHSAGHLSYPAPLACDGTGFVVPETSDWAPVSAYPMSPDGLREPFELRVPGRPRLLDPTPLRHGDAVYLFGNVASEGASVLRLWVADALDGDFTEHPDSPIRISPNGARMAGIPLMMADGRLLRVGQDSRRSYGDGIAFFAVTQLDRSHYAERLIGQYRFAEARGPHTLNLGRGEVAFDYYDDAISLFAGVHRLRHRRAARRIGD